MSDSVKVALILSVAIVLATTITVSALIYFSPFQTCVRAGPNLVAFCADRASN